MKTAIFMLAIIWLAAVIGCEGRQQPVMPAEEQTESLQEESPPAEEDPALTKKKRANEAAAHASLRVLATAQAQYRRRAQDGRYGSLKELGEQDLIIGELAAATVPEKARNGYYYMLTPDEFEWSCVALPVQPGVSGDYSYYVDQSGIVRRAPCATTNDKPAGPESPAMH